MASVTKNQEKKGNFVAIVTMFFLFAMISFVTNLAAPLGTIWQGSYDWSGMVGNFMNFFAYLIMGIPAGKMLERIGYKKTALWALALGAIGMSFQYLSSLVGATTETFSVGGQPVMLNFLIYLLGAFIGGFCVCMLNTVVNPILNGLGGGGNRGNALLQLGGSFNSLAGTLTPLFVGMLVGNVTKDTTMGNVAPLLWIAIGVFIVAFIIISFVQIPEPNNAGGGKSKTKDPHSAWSFRHTVLGVVGIFFYVGLEVGIPGMLIFYLQAHLGENGLATATAVAAIYWLLMLVGRLCSSVISNRVSGRAQLIAVSSFAICLVILAICLGNSGFEVTMPSYSVEHGFDLAKVPFSALLLVLCGLCTSLMWGGIFNLAVEGIGKYTAQASGIFMMMVVGGGVMPLIQNAIAKSAGYLTSYWLIVAMLGYLLYYALFGSKNVNRDIPVEEEETSVAIEDSI